MKFRTADFALGDDFDFRDTWGVEREYTLDTFAVGNFTDGESGVDTAAAFGDDETLIALCAEIEQAAPWAHRRPTGYP